LGRLSLRRLVDQMTDLFKIISTEPAFIEDSKNAPWDDLIEEDFHVKVFADKYPVTEGHLLFVPKYNTTHVLSDALNDAILLGLKKLQAGEWDGFNVGVNVGMAAGQTVEWPHVHLIPRRKGDMEDPTGGVRHVIPEKGNYRKTK
jgi:diadenosine tetraphosphate (Ap4A) HIT family hydrolase